MIYQIKYLSIQTCEKCGKQFTEDDRSLSAWTRIILSKPTLCNDCKEQIINVNKTDK